MQNLSNTTQMWATTSSAQEDTYDPQEAQALVTTVHRTLPLHGCLRRAVATAATTAFVALGQDWNAEARAHFPEVFTEAAGDILPLKHA